MSEEIDYKQLAKDFSPTPGCKSKKNGVACKFHFTSHSGKHCSGVVTDGNFQEWFDTESDSPPMTAQNDPVNHPRHYCSHPSGIECITITEHHNFCIGNALKYLWRSEEKGAPIEDLRKAIWYIEREISRREKSK
jgi:hypothetical protein